MVNQVIFMSVRGILTMLCSIYPTTYILLTYFDIFPYNLFSVIPFSRKDYQ